MNENETCHRIIYPLLLEAGYGHLEIRTQDSDAAKGKPDYTILPDAPDYTWFLEAKAWNVTLDDTHAMQAINYANTQGKRWVVLSNGREWRLYDNKTFGTAEVKLASVAHLSEDGFASFLESLSKASILQGKLEDFVRNSRLYTSLGSQITRLDSDVVKAITKVLRSAPGLDSVVSADVVGFFRDYASGSPHQSQEAEAVPVAPPTPVVQAAQPPTREEHSAAGSVLGSLSYAAITGRKPKALRLPNGDMIPLPKWYDLPIQAAIYAAVLGKMPKLPLYKGKTSKSPLMAVAGSPEATPMREPKALPAPNDGIVVECHFSAYDHQTGAVRILEAAGVDPSGFTLFLAE